MIGYKKFYMYEILRDGFYIKMWIKCLLLYCFMNIFRFYEKCYIIFFKNIIKINYKKLYILIIK